jgi:hypothetical protein
MAAGRAEAAGRGYYVYGIVGSERPALGELTGIDGNSLVYVLEEDGLAAIVSEVPLDEFGDEALQRNLEEPSWLEAKVRAHEQVLEQATRQAPVLPLRFGTVYRTLDPLRELLAGQREGLASALEQLRGKREWGVKCVLDQERLEQAVQSTDAQASELAEAAEGKPPGKAYFERKKLARHVDERAEELAARLGAEAHERLEAVADRGIRESRGALKGAYLVEETREDDFRRALHELSRDYDRFGLRFELSGPWPPYSFVEEQA